MRIDKFLKVSRIIVRRTIAKEACDAQRIIINNKIAKASDEIRVNDIIEIKFNNRQFRVKVLEIKEQVSKKDASKLYEEII